MTSWHKFACNIPATTSERLIKPHYSDVIMGARASQITSLIIVYSTGYSGADQRKHQSSASLAFLWGIRWWPVNSPHKWPGTRKMFPFDEVIMLFENGYWDYLEFHIPRSSHWGISNMQKCYADIIDKRLTHWGRVTHICVGKPTIIG